MIAFIIAHLLCLQFLNSIMLYAYIESGLKLGSMEINNLTIWQSSGA